MNKRATAILLAAAMLLAIAFFWLWQRQQPQVPEMVQLCQSGAAEALEEFRAFQATGEEYHYWYGVAEFRIFMQAYRFLEEPAMHADYSYCNAVYGQMVLAPQLVMENMDTLIDALEYLAEDCTDPNGFLHMAALMNQLIR